MKSIEQIRTALLGVLQEWCAPKLLLPNYWSNKTEPPITFEVAQNQDGHIIIKMVVRYGPFGDSVRKSKFVYHSFSSFDDDALLVNILLNSLTFQWSPYYINKRDKKFFKRLEVLG
jgi:hypothetical protein